MPLKGQRQSPNILSMTIWKQISSVLHTFSYKSEERWKPKQTSFDFKWTKKKPWMDCFFEDDKAKEYETSSFHFFRSSLCEKSVQIDSSLKTWMPAIYSWIVLHSTCIRQIVQLLFLFSMKLLSSYCNNFLQAILLMRSVFIHFTVCAI